MKALVIEDDSNVALLYRKWLEGCGYEVTTVDSIKEAQRCLDEAPDIRIITLDLNLTDSTYLTTIPKIKNMRDSNPGALLVVISGVITHNDEKLVTSLGADAMFEKNEVATEKTFLGKLRDMLGGLAGTPVGFQNRAKVLQGIAEKVARRCNTLGCNIGESLLNLDPGTTGHDSGTRQPPKEHIPQNP